jgi:hypothetical protein
MRIDPISVNFRVKSGVTLQQQHKVLTIHMAGWILSI